MISGNKFTCQLVRMLLANIGITEIDVSHEPGHAEHLLTISRFDLIVVDAGAASGFDWLALVEMLRALPDKAQADTPAVLLASDPTKELITRARQAQIGHVVVKPFAAGVLCGQVQDALGTASYVPGPGRAYIIRSDAGLSEPPPDLIV
jgi:CheY-like chemotaxis protein